MLVVDTFDCIKQQMFRYTSTELLAIRYDCCPAPRPVRRCGKRAGRRRSRPILAPAENGAFVFTGSSNRHHSPRVARHPPNILPVRTLRHTEAKGGEVIFGLLNIRSLNNKLHDLLEVCREHSPKVIGLCETWHDETSAWIGQLLNDGYQVVERARSRPQDEADRLSTNHGGVAICVAPGIRLSKLQFMHQFLSFELVIARVTSVESCILAVVYRPGSAKSSQLFFSEMSELLGELASHNGPVYVAGDLNVRLDRDEDAACRQLCELFTSYNFTFQPTNATHVGGEMLDVVAFHCGTVAPQTRVIDVGLSDHHLVSWSVPLTRPRPVYVSTTRRAWRKVDTIAFLNELATSKLCQPALWPMMDVDEMARLYDQEITDIVERLVPVTTATCRRRPSDPWFDDECREAKRKMRFAERKARSTHADPRDAATLESHWKELRRAYRLLLRRKREAFWNNKVDSERVDPRRLWQSLNTLLGRGRTRAHETPSADDFAEYLHNKDVLAHASVTEHDSPTFSPLLTQCSLSSFQPLSPDEVAAEIRALPDKQCASDPMPTALLKESSYILAPFLSELFNRSMSSGSVPEIFKSAYITPRLKKPNLDTADIKSFRPISNLSVLSKLLERLVSHQFIRYLTTFNLLPDLQSAYRVHHSTETAVLKVSLDILRALDAGDVAIFVLLDLTAAFDTVDHGTLLKKLEASYGVSSRVLQWFSSYLMNRVQHVCCAGSTTLPTCVDVEFPKAPY